LPDPRAANARHDLLEVLVIALAAVLCGAAACSDMADFGRAKEDLLRRFLRLENGIPSHDTFSWVFRLLKRPAFEAAFRRFMAAFARANGLTLTGVVALDGKALRSAFERGQSESPLHLVNVWAVEARMALAQHKAPGRNETAGALEVLELLSLEGCIVTTDALHCHRAMATTILERGGDYVLAIKGNRGPLFAAVLRQLARSGKRSTAEQLEPSTHGRREQRRATPRRECRRHSVSCTRPRPTNCQAHLVLQRWPHTRAQPHSTARHTIGHAAWAPSGAAGPQAVMHRSQRSPQRSAQQPRCNPHQSGHRHWTTHPVHRISSSCAVDSSPHWRDPSFCKGRQRTGGPCADLAQ
jgi:predicted transposase YbfD/YdcC